MSEIIVLVMVYVDKSCATTSTWKPDARFRVTNNYMQPTPDYSKMMYTIYNDLTLISLTLWHVYM